jgi:hypothetical protein
MKLASQMPSSTSLTPSFWPASTSGTACHLCSGPLINILAYNLPVQLAQNILLGDKLGDELRFPNPRSDVRVRHKTRASENTPELFLRPTIKLVLFNYNDNG